MGLTTDISVPDFETRMAILEKKMYADGIELPHDVVEFVAYNVSSNVRELEGALISLLAQSSLNKKDIDLETAKKIIKNFVKSISREVSIDFIQKAVCEYFSVPMDKLKEKPANGQWCRPASYQCTWQRVLPKFIESDWSSLWRPGS